MVQPGEIRTDREATERFFSIIDTKGQLHERELSRGYKKTTNNRMELMAAIVALEALNRPCQVDLYSDSKYLVDAFNQHWIDSWLKKNWKRGKNEDVKKRRISGNAF